LLRSAHGPSVGISSLALLIFAVLIAFFG